MHASESTLGFVIDRYRLPWVPFDTIISYSHGPFYLAFIHLEQMCLHLQTENIDLFGSTAFFIRHLIRRCLKFLAFAFLDVRTYCLDQGRVRDIYQLQVKMGIMLQ
jgi:hypothetical protein